jgi:hypothetical protein
MAKTPISLRIDGEVLEWFRGRFPSGYQSAMTRVLRDFAEREKLEEFIAAYREGKVDVGPPITADELIAEQKTRIDAPKATSAPSTRTRPKRGE